MICPECQKAYRRLLTRIPTIETPIISIPYYRMAFDIVGPLKRTKQEYLHILMAMCMTRYPYRATWKRVDAILVANGLMEILSHTGIPFELLTYQGTLFMCKICSELCRLLHIKLITTTAYHPQNICALERWHGCHTGMLWKLEVKVEQWNLLLKYCLLAYQATPHAASGSPFKFVHDRPLHGPLESIKDV